MNFCIKVKCIVDQYRQIGNLLENFSCRFLSHLLIVTKICQVYVVY